MIYESTKENQTMIARNGDIAIARHKGSTAKAYYGGTVL